MTMRTFRSYDPDELWLLPPSPRDWLPEDHLAYFLADVVEELNLQPILATYGGVTRGTAPYHPQLLVKVLLYAYAVGIPASRQIARKLDEEPDRWQPTQTSSPRAASSATCVAGLCFCCWPWSYIGWVRTFLFRVSTRRSCSNCSRGSKVAS